MRILEWYKNNYSSGSPVSVHGSGHYNDQNE